MERTNDPRAFGGDLGIKAVQVDYVAHRAVLRVIEYAESVEGFGLTDVSAAARRVPAHRRLAGSR